MQLLGGAPRLGGRMNAPERLEPLRIEALGAERYACDAGRPVFAECAALDRARVGFERHLQARGELEHVARRREELADRARREEARRPAAEEDADHLAPGDLTRLRFEIARETAEVGALRELPGERVGVEIAVRTLAHAPRKVHVERERRRDESTLHRRPEPSKLARPRKA